MIQPSRTFNERSSIPKKMVAIKQVVLGVIITTVLLGEENTIARLVKAQPLPYKLSEHPCTNYINLTEFGKLCYLYNIDRRASYISWYKFNYSNYSIISYRYMIQNAWEPCPLKPCHPCRNDSDVKFGGILNITYCHPFYIYQLPEFRCVLLYQIGYLYDAQWNNTGPLYNCSNSSNTKCR